MPRNKPRLELALYARPKHPGTYHWALFVSAKPNRQRASASVTKYHVKNTLQNVHGELAQPWRYERVVDLAIERERLQRLLVRVVIAKVPSVDLLEDLLATVPIYQRDDADRLKALSFSCSTWLRDALEALGTQGAITGIASWNEVKTKALAYVEKKAQEGSWSAGRAEDVGVPMLDLLDGKEIAV
ncbi:hypothetical protein K504DRAFT_387627 [Pleomassaria siparia CBS 279.74]|uniref:Uncharacterized protein n=1 Tax=Pleomassaria siparia CBS 279.74 TaxID=1314801 RepID=A0A6G1JZJ6_9PLEO|nr:hypothetical protein K504DRAFT_387627 [Pleomassaria siparia CBS 279.74]